MRSRILQWWSIYCLYYGSIIVLLLVPVVHAFSFLHQVTDWLNQHQITFTLMESSQLQQPQQQHQYLSSSSSSSSSSHPNSRQQTHLVWIHPPQSGLLLHLIPSYTYLDCTIKYQMTNQASSQQQQQQPLIHLHQDQWEYQPQIVQARLWNAIVTTLPQQQHIKLTHARRIYGRQCHVQRISNTEAQTFLQKYHMWSSVMAKYSYGLFVPPDDNEIKYNDDAMKKIPKNQKDTSVTINHHTLVAVATFSSRRHIQRGYSSSSSLSYRSHELLRYCTQYNVTIVGGRSKLIQAFVRDVQPDDIVTVLDRDWTSTRQQNWKGFESVHIMSPLPLAIKNGLRYHLIGIGSKQYENNNNNNNNNNTSSSSSSSSNNNNNSTIVPRRNATTVTQRLLLPKQMYDELNTCETAEMAYTCLQQHGYDIIYDSGVERLMQVLRKDVTTTMNNNHNNNNNNNNNSNSNKQDGIDSSSSSSSSLSVIELYQTSIPQYASSYYSPNQGIAALLREAEQKCQSIEVTNIL